MKKLITTASICLGLDIVAFIATSLFILSSTNIWYTIFLGIILYIIAWDAYNASKYIIDYFKN